MDDIFFQVKKRIWEKDAYISASKTAIEKIHDQNKIKEEYITKYKVENDKLLPKIYSLSTIKERMSSNDKALSANLINLMQYTRSLEKIVNDDKSKIEETLMKFNDNYLNFKNQIESSHFIYKNLKDAQIDYNRIDFDYKYHKVELQDIRDEFKFKKLIQRRIVISNIINFVKSVKRYNEARDVLLEIKKLKVEESQLINIYEKKLKAKKHNKNINIDSDLNSFFMPTFEQYQCFRSTPQKKNVTFQLDNLFKASVDNIGLLQTAARIKKCETETIHRDQKSKNISILKIEHFKPSDFLLPEPPKKIRKTKSNDTIENLPSSSNSKSTGEEIMENKKHESQERKESYQKPTLTLDTAKTQASANQTGIINQEDVSPFKLISQQPVCDFMRSKYFEELQTKEISKVTNDYNSQRENSSPAKLFDKQEEQIAPDSLKSLSGKSQESSFTQQVLRWQKRFDTSLLKPYDNLLSIDESNVNSAILQETSLAKGLSLDAKEDEAMENYNNTTFSPPRNVSNLLNTNSLQNNVFKLEDVSSLTRSSFNFKESQRFNMF